MNLEILDSLPIESLKELQIAIKKIISKKKKLLNAEKRVSFINTLHYSQTSSYERAFKKVKEYNSKNLLSLYNLNNKLHTRANYFHYLMLQDWSHLYKRDSDSGCFYVYCHVDPSERVFVTKDILGGNYKGLPFYVGKGTKNRAFDLKRNQGHGKKIKEVLDKGFTPDQIVHIAFDNLSEGLAFEIEAKLIYLFGSIYQGDRKHTSLLNLDIPKTPEFVDVMVKMPFRRHYNSEGKEITP